MFYNKNSISNFISIQYLLIYFSVNLLNHLLNPFDKFTSDSINLNLLLSLNNVFNQLVTI